MKFIAVLLFAIMTTTVGAQDLTYPELHVTPRASERIRLEIKDEAGHAWASHMPVQLSAISTLAAGFMMSGNVDTKRDEKEVSPKIGIAFGAAWLGATIWASMKYRPYRRAYSRLRKMKYGSLREKLTAERLAEEELSNLRTMGKRIRWFSFFTNIAASAFMYGSAKDDSDGQKVSGLAGLMAFAPLIFPYHWETVANEQDKYKKKIYAPVAMAPILMDPTNRYAATGAGLLWKF